MAGAGNPRLDLGPKQFKIGSKRIHGTRTQDEFQNLMEQHFRTSSKMILELYIDKRLHLHGIVGVALRCEAKRNSKQPSIPSCLAHALPSLSTSQPFLSSLSPTCGAGLQVGRGSSNMHLVAQVHPFWLRKGVKIRGVMGGVGGKGLGLF